MNQKRLNSYFLKNFECDRCGNDYYDKTAYSPAPSLNEINDYSTYCSNCVVEDEPESSCSFFTRNEQDERIACDKPLFDKKKQLCRSHNRQVWKKFNEFTKDMSVSSTAAWLTTWDQSSDWKYFWDLAAEKKEKELTLNSPLDNKKNLSEIKKSKKSLGLAPIHETTENIKSLEIDKRTLTKTGRTYQLGTRVKKEFLEQLKSIAYEERLKLVEVLEKALECYEKHRRK